MLPSVSYGYAQGGRGQDAVHNKFGSSQGHLFHTEVYCAQARNNCHAFNNERYVRLKRPNGTHVVITVSDYLFYGLPDEAAQAYNGGVGPLSGTPFVQLPYTPLTDEQIRGELEKSRKIQCMNDGSCTECPPKYEALEPPFPKDHVFFEQATKAVIELGKAFYRDNPKLAILHNVKLEEPTPKITDADLANWKFPFYPGTGEGPVSGAAGPLPGDPIGTQRAPNVPSSPHAALARGIYDVKLAAPPKLTSSFTFHVPFGSLQATQATAAQSLSHIPASLRSFNSASAPGREIAPLPQWAAPGPFASRTNSPYRQEDVQSKDFMESYSDASEIFEDEANEEWNRSDNVGISDGGSSSTDEHTANGAVAAQFPNANSGGTCQWLLEDETPCGVVCADRPSAREHGKVHFTPLFPEGSKGKKAKCRMLGCDQKRPTVEGSWYRHYLSHFEPKWICPVCERSISRSDTFTTKRHMRKHGENPELEVSLFSF